MKAKVEKERSFWANIVMLGLLVSPYVSGTVVGMGAHLDDPVWVIEGVISAFVLFLFVSRRPWRRFFVALLSLVTGVFVAFLWLDSKVWLYIALIPGFLVIVGAIGMVNSYLRQAKATDRGIERLS